MVPVPPDPSKNSEPRKKPKNKKSATEKQSSKEPSSSSPGSNKYWKRETHRLLTLKNEDIDSYSHSFVITK